MSIAARSRFTRAMRSWAVDSRQRNAVARCASKVFSMGGMIARMNAYNGDAVVIGGGLAGIVTALELLDAGKRVVLLDRAPRAELGGLARESFGGILFVGTPEQARAKVHDTPEIALRDWLAFGD